MTGSGYPEGSQAVTALVVGILGLVLCQVLGPVAWYLGNQEISAIDGGRRAPENRGMAVTARVLKFKLSDHLIPQEKLATFDY